MENMQKTYLIIGASSDIGLQYILYLENKKETCRVIAHYHSSSKLLEEYSAQFCFVTLELIQADLLIESEVVKMLDELKNRDVCPDYILHLPAGRFETMPIKQFKWELYETELNIQVKSLGMAFAAFLPQMAKRKSGKVVVMLTSYVYDIPPKYMSHYIVAKYALLGLMKAAASEYMGKGLQINALSPAMIETKFLSNIDDRAVEINARNSKLGRNLLPEDVIPTIDFLFSSGADCMNGANINLSAGENM